MFVLDLRLLDNYSIGTVESMENGVITITKESYAPGIWAGSEGMKIQVPSEGFFPCLLEVVSVNLENRSFDYKFIPNESEVTSIDSGTKLFIYKG